MVRFIFNSRLLLLVHHGRLAVFLEALAETLLHGEGLLHAAGDAAILARRESLGGELVDAGGEAGLEHVVEHLEYVVSGSSRFRVWWKMTIDLPHWGERVGLRDCY